MLTLVTSSFSQIIRLLGGVGSYSSMHIRRGDLQYASSLQSAEATLANTKALLKEGETLYISTDEKPEFFAALRQAGYTVHTYKDLLPQAFPGVTLDRKIVGMVEQIVASGGRTYFGTRLSTFSSFVLRMRGYSNHWTTKDKKTYFHNFKYTGGPGDDVATEDTMQYHEWSREYKTVWEDLYRRRTLLNAEGLGGFGAIGYLWDANLGWQLWNAAEEDLE